MLSATVTIAVIVDASVSCGSNGNHMLHTMILLTMVTNLNRWSLSGNCNGGTPSGLLFVLCVCPFPMHLCVSTTLTDWTIYFEYRFIHKQQTSSVVNI